MRFDFHLDDQKFDSIKAKLAEIRSKNDPDLHVVVWSDATSTIFNLRVDPKLVPNGEIRPVKAFDGKFDDGQLAVHLDTLYHALEYESIHGPCPCINDPDYHTRKRNVNTSLNQSAGDRDPRNPDTDDCLDF